MTWRNIRKEAQFFCNTAVRTYFGAACLSVPGARLGMPAALPIHNSYPWRGAQTLPLHFIHDMQPLLFCEG